MKREQFSEYQRISEEIKPVKAFLTHCGNRYHDRYLCKPFFGLMCRERAIFLFRKWHLGNDESNTFEIPKDLQDRIIETVEQWVDEQEEELSKI